PDDVATLGRRVVGLLEAIKPPSARLRLLADLDRCPPQACLPQVAIGDELLRVARPPQRLRAATAACRALWACELYRLAGDPVRATELALSASRVLRPHDPYALFVWAMFADRTGNLRPHHANPPDDVPDELPGYPERPLLRGAYAL